MDLVERMVLSKMEKYREKANRDRFIVNKKQDIITIKQLIDRCIDF
jgi:hypothetical protein